jgi:hypothetical protein
MKSLIYYLLQVTIASGILYGYYHFVLRNKKFHHYNRFYLLAAALICMLIPLLQIPVYFSEDSTPPVVLQSLNLITVNSYSDTPAVFISPPKTNWLNWQHLSWSCYVLISFLFLLKIIFSLCRIRSIVRNNVIEKLDHINFVNTNEPETPFSFFRWMFWNRNIELSSEKGEQVFRHELFHIQQKHSWDIIFIELMTIVFWINPFFHLIRKELKAIHEFLADEFAVKKNQEWKYAEFLLMQALNTQSSLITPFFHNQIKRRIAMITTSKKPSYQYLRKLMVIPITVIAVGLVSFSYKQRLNRSSEGIPIENFTDTTPPNKGRVPMVIMLSAPKPWGKVVPSSAQLSNWQDEKNYGVWINEHRIQNNYLKNFHAKDFSHYFVSNLTPIARKNDGFNVQVDLMTNDYYTNSYLKNWNGNRKIKISTTVAPDTVPKELKKYSNALILVDGKEKTADELNEVDPNNIYSITIWKDKSSAEKYGDKGKNGVIEVITKRFRYENEKLKDSVILRTKVEEVAERMEDLKKNVDTTTPKSYFYFDEKIKTFTGFYERKKIQRIMMNVSTNDVLLELAGNEKIKITSKQASYWGLPFEDLKEPLRFNEKGYKIVVVVNQDHQTIAVAYKNGPASVFHFTGNEAQKKWEQTYGSIPKPPPPPPSAGSNTSSNNQIDQVWTKVEVEASFPGGDAAWSKFIVKNLNARVPVTNKAPNGKYTVWVKFVVDKDGDLSDFRALTNNGFGMEEEAVRVMRLSSKWNPAMQNGKKVTAYRLQPITFVLVPVNGNVQLSEPSKKEEGKRLNEVIAVADNSNYVWTDVDVEASFPGGDGALKKFLKANMDESIAGKNGAAKDQYHVVVLQFIVDKDGNTSGWQALTNLGYGMEEEALRAMKKTPKWIPARRDGHYVTAYRKQPVAFLVGESPYYIQISKQELENTTPFSLLKLQPGEEVVSFKMTLDAVGIKPQEFDLTGNEFSDEAKTRISTIQIETYIYLENIKVRYSNRIVTKPPMYGSVIPERLNTNAFKPKDASSWNFNDPEFKEKWQKMISDIKAIAWKEGKAAYEYQGRTYVFGKIKNPDPTVASFTEQNGTGHVFLLNGELVTSIDKLNGLITRSDVKKFGFISQEEARKKFNRDDAIVSIETYDSYLTKK